MKISRRDFLKLGTAAAACAYLSPRLLSALDQASVRPNIIILLLDALTARNMSLYGYVRETTPNLARFAGCSTVYHAHSSGGNFTTPGTASMLTGMLPWKHRAFNLGGFIKSDLVRFNPFSLLGAEYYRFLFSQNPWPARLVSQAYADVDQILSANAYSLRRATPVMDRIGKDRGLASIAVEEFLLSLGADTMGSSVLGHVYKESVLSNMVAQEKAHPEYPVGLPEVEGIIIPFRNEDIYAGVANELAKMQAGNNPYFSYFHLFSPHSPYRPHRKYVRLFRDDNYAPPAKPLHPLVAPQPDEVVQRRRIMYDMQVANVDGEFGNLVKRMEADGILDNSYVIITSDHGEMFERGFWGHGGVMMYDPSIHIPLLIHAPGQASRVDVQTPTSNVDVLPTLLSLVGRDVPSELDGQVLPGFSDVYDSDKPVFTMDSSQNPAFASLKKISISMRKGDLKLIATLGYTEADIFELYNLADDPEELQNLFQKDTVTFQRLRDELLSHLADANRPYER
jgi:arylsulfatase A-like enzyme